MRKVCFLFFLCMLMACGDNFYSSVPDARVSFACNLSTAPYMFITTAGQFMTVKKTTTGFVVNYPGQPAVADNTEKARYARLGFAGIAIGNSTYNGYCAFDLACPVEGNMKTIVELKEGGLGKAVCPKCGTLYNLNNGGVPEKGVSKERLKPYAVSQMGDNLSVSN